MARRFQFRLETLERLRRQARDAERRAVAERLRAVAAADATMARLAAQWSLTIEQSRESQGVGRIDIAGVRDQQVHRGWLRRRMTETAAERVIREDRLRKAQATLVEASKRLKVIEKLHECQLARHRDELAREDQGNFDEAALNLHRRIASEGGREGAE